MVGCFPPLPASPERLLHVARAASELLTGAPHVVAVARRTRGRRTHTPHTPRPPPIRDRRGSSSRCRPSHEDIPSRPRHNVTSGSGGPLKSAGRRSPLQRARWLHPLRWRPRNLPTSPWRVRRRRASIVAAGLATRPTDESTDGLHRRRESLGASSSAP